jgi:smad nuclear-interacting protein 1
MDDLRGRGRWSDDPARHPPPPPPPPPRRHHPPDDDDDDDDDLAMAALLGEASARSEERSDRDGRGGGRGGRGDGGGGGGGRGGRGGGGGGGGRGRYDDPHRGGMRGRDDGPVPGHYGGNADHPGKRVVEEEDDDYDMKMNARAKRRRRWDDDRGHGGAGGGDVGNYVNRATSRKGDAIDVDEDGGGGRTGGGDENPNKVRANFALSGALASDVTTGNARMGITLRFTEPPEARVPNTRWRLYVFRKRRVEKNDDDPASSAKSNGECDDDGLIDTYHISRQSSYLFGRERKVADVPVDHPSLSKQHAVLQYRALPPRGGEEQRRGEGSGVGGGTMPKLLCRPYLMDLESTNGTFVNGVRLDPARYYELRRGDVITFGASTREYVLLTEQSARTGI